MAFQTNKIQWQIGWLSSQDKFVYNIIIHINITHTFFGRIKKESIDSHKRTYPCRAPTEIHCPIFGNGNNNKIFEPH